MSTARIKKQFEKMSHMDEVEPTKALLLCSMKCEKRTAAIRNKSIRNMKENEISAVAYRYLQNKAGETKSTKEIATWVLLVYLFMNQVSSNNGLLNIPILMFGILSGLFIPPNFSNILRYKETRNDCEEWLSIKMNKQFLNEIQQLNYDKEGMFKLNRLLKKEHVDTNFLSQRLNKFKV